MATITEDYVSLEIAKLLKEKGFDVETEHEMWYVIKQFSTGCHWNSCTYKVGDITREYDDDCCISMPTLQMACKWLRKVHRICIVIMPVVTDDDGDAGCLWNYIISRKLEALHKSECLYESHEIALNDAIKYCLENLI